MRNDNLLKSEREADADFKRNFGRMDKKKWIGSKAFFVIMCLVSASVWYISWSKKQEERDFESAFQLAATKECRFNQILSRAELDSADSNNKLRECVSELKIQFMRASEQFFRGPSNPFVVKK